MVWWCCGCGWLKDAKRCKFERYSPKGAQNRRAYQSLLLRFGGPEGHRRWLSTSEVAGSVCGAWEKTVTGNGYPGREKQNGTYAANMTPRTSIELSTILLLAHSSLFPRSALHHMGMRLTISLYFRDGNVHILSDGKTSSIARELTNCKTGKHDREALTPFQPQTHNIPRR